MHSVSDAGLDTCDVRASLGLARTYAGFRFYFIFFGGYMNCFSYDMIYAYSYRSLYQFMFFFFCLGWGILPLESNWSLSCDHGLGYAS